MAEITKHAPGTFCWSELSTTDQNGAKKYYTALFGWTTEDIPMGEGPPYTMLRLRGKEVGALCTLQPEQQKMGVPPHWLPYVSVANADETVRKAGELGGKVLMGAFDVFDLGRMAVLQDPQGATFAIWQPKKHIGATVKDEPSSLCWTELMTTNVDAAGRFYTRLFDWGTNVMPMPSGPYTVFKVGETSAGGMMAITPEMGPVPPNWMVYWQVADCDKSAAKAKELGGKIVVPPTDVPNVGRFAVIADPQGGHFSIFKM